MEEIGLKTDNMQIFQLNKKRALVTGGGSGIGYGIAKQLKEAGAEVIILGRTKEKIMNAATELGDGVYPICFDLSNLKEIPNLVNEIENKFGSVDILVNCAGNHLKKPALETTDEEFLEILEVHLLSVFALTRECARGMVKRRDGSILLISSMSAIFGVEQIVAYSTAKSAILGMMKSLVAELSPYKIRINTIAPGWIETPMLKQAVDNDPERKQKIRNRIPNKAFGQPSDVGYACVYLASDAGRYLNGIFLPVDGGAAIGF